MNKAYDRNISEQTKRSRCSRAIAVTIFVFLIVVCVCGSGLQAFAGAQDTSNVCRYYKTIRIEEGDTLWDIAGNYAKSMNMSRNAYIDEVCRLNGICRDEIYAGKYIVIIYLADIIAGDETSE